MIDSSMTMTDEHTSDLNHTNGAPAENILSPSPPVPPIASSIPEGVAGDDVIGKNRRRSHKGGMGGRRAPYRGQAQAGLHQVSDYEEKNIEVARVTRVTKGGKRMRFRVLSIIGNHQGRVGYGLAKGADVASATAKATAKARKSLFTVPLMNETIPQSVESKFSAAHVLLKPAPKGSGVKAGGAIRAVLQLAGVPNVVSKMLGSSNKISNVKATFAALRSLRMPAVKKDADEQVVSSA